MNISRKQKVTITVITAECIVFSIFSILLGTLNISSTAARHEVLAYLLIPALCIIVLMTVIRYMSTQVADMHKLEQKLDEERSESRKVQRQFEKDIDKRTFELQRINGSLNREIAERIQAEEELRELQKQLGLILDSAGEGILGLDNNGKVVFMNTAASVMLGWEKEELLGNTHHEFIHHTRPDGTPHPVESCPIYMAYRDGQIHYKTGDVFWSKNGASFPVEYVSTPIRDRGMLTGAVVVFRDMNTFT